MVIRLTACALALLAAGCSNLDVPRANNYPASDQKKARAVHHWDVLAEDVASQVSATLNTLGVAKTIYVEAPTEKTEFNKAFASLVTTQLVRKGLQVSTKPSGTTLLRFDTQVVQHHSSWQGINGGDFRYTQLAGGVVAAYGIGNAIDHSFYRDAAIPLIAFPFAIAADMNQMQKYGNAAGGPTRTEVLVNASLVHGDRFLARNSTIYYIQYEEGVNFEKDKLGKTWGVTGQGSTAQ